MFERWTNQKRQPKYFLGVIERFVRMLSEAGSEYPLQSRAITSIAAKIGCTPETLPRWVRQQETNTGQCPGVTTAAQEHMKVLERENRELRNANDILRLASAYFAHAELDCRFKS